MKNLIGIVSVLIFAVVLAGCSEPIRIIKPEVSVANVWVGESKDQMADVFFTVKVENVNPFELVCAGAYYNIYLNETYIGKGFKSKDFELPKLQSVDQMIRIRVAHNATLSLIQTLISAGEADYRIESSIFPEDHPQLVAVHSGHFELLPPPQKEKKEGVESGEVAVEAEPKGEPVKELEIEITAPEPVPAS